MERIVEPRTIGSTRAALTRKLTELRQKAWRLMQAPLAVQHRWHYGY
ncbi:hypothetical protein [Mesorhizobium sp. WSM2561]|nr:hypothetical protein [Mesorhizobium sp. WSM2561]